MLSSSGFIINLMKVQENFSEIEKHYTKAREIQRGIIIDFLNDNGFTKLNDKKITRHGGKGIPNYTSQGRFEVPYDLTIHKYIMAYKDGFAIFISLQPPEQDKVSKNWHALFNRLGVRVYPINEPNEDTPIKNVNEIKITNIDLPLTVSKLNGLLSFINNEIEILKKENL